VWLPEGEWIEWPTGKHFTGPISTDRNFSIEQTPVYLRAGAIVPMQPPMRFTGEKPVDPLIVNLWPLASGTASSYSVYEDSGVSVEYQRGVFARTPIKAAQTGDTLRIEIGPVQGGYPGMPRTRGFELRLPADWPPVSITINGVVVKHAGPTGKGGWSFEGNTLTTKIPVPSRRVEGKVTVELRRASGMTERRGELDGFAGALTRLRGAYDAMQQTWPVSEPPDALIDAMQTGDRLTYYPEKAQEEIARFRELLPKAQAAIDEIGLTFSQRLSTESWHTTGMDMKTQKQYQLDSFARAQRLLVEAGK
jgi:alpha-glucosidase